MFHDSLAQFKSQNLISDFILFFKIIIRIQWLILAEG